MNNNHDIKDLDLLYLDANKLLNEIVDERIDKIILKRIEETINDLKDCWHGNDAIKEINKLIEVKNLLIDNRDIAGNIGVYIALLAKNYRDAQNANGNVLPSLNQLNYVKISKSETIDASSSELFMSDDIGSVVTSLTSLLSDIEELNETMLIRKNSILDNWIQDDDNRNFAVKMFKKFYDNTDSICKKINDIIKCTNTSIENYNASKNKVDNTMPSLESMFISNNSKVNEYTNEEKVVLKSIEKRLDNNKNISDKFNNILYSEVKKDLQNRGIIE